MRSMALRACSMVHIFSLRLGSKQTLTPCAFAISAARMTVSSALSLTAMVMPVRCSHLAEAIYSSSSCSGLMALAAEFLR